jgi:hypothetical protein
MMLLIVEIDKLMVIDDYYLIIVFQFYQNILYLLIYDELSDPFRKYKKNFDFF